MNPASTPIALASTAGGEGKRANRAADWQSAHRLRVLLPSHHVGPGFGAAQRATCRYPGWQAPAREGAEAVNRGPLDDEGEDAKPHACGFETDLRSPYHYWPV